MELTAIWHHLDIPAPACQSKQVSSFFLLSLFGLASKRTSAKAREVTCTAHSDPVKALRGAEVIISFTVKNIILSPPDLSNFRLVWSCAKLTPWTKMTQKSTRLCPNDTGRQSDSVLPWAWSALAWKKWWTWIRCIRSFTWKAWTGSDGNNGYFVTIIPPHWYYRTVIIAIVLSSNRYKWYHIISHSYCDPLIATMNDHVISFEPVATQSHNRDECTVISSSPIAIKGHNSRAAQLLLSRS
jgi:hypothetical protein